MGVNINYFYEGAPTKALPLGEPGRLNLADKREAAAHSSEGVALIEALATVRSAKMRKAMVTVVRAMAAVSA